MSETVGRNDPCPCGSGLKFKRCCALEPEVDRTGSFFRIALYVVGALMLVVTVGVARELIVTDEDEARRIWSPEHGHWHVVGGGEEGAIAAPGRVWSEEHGHWHQSATVSHESIRPTAFDERIAVEVERGVIEAEDAAAAGAAQ